MVRNTGDPSRRRVFVPIASAPCDGRTLCDSQIAPVKTRGQPEQRPGVGTREGSPVKSCSRQR
eukprot:4794401-Prymnesium_polylepis.1